MYNYRKEVVLLKGIVDTSRACMLIIACGASCNYRNNTIPFATKGIITTVIVDGDNVMMACQL